MPFERDIDLAVTYGLFPVEGAPGQISIGIMVTMVMKSVLVNQFLTQMRVIYGPRPDDAKFRDMTKSMVVDLRTQYDELIGRQLNGPMPPFTVPGA